MAKKPPPDTFRIPVPLIPIPGLPGVSIGGNLTIVVQPNGGVSIPSFGIKIRFGSEPPTDVPLPPPPDPRLNPPDPIPFPFGGDTHDDHDDGAAHDDHDDQPHDDHDDEGAHDDHDDQPHDDHDDQPHDDHDDQPHNDHDDQPHDDHDDQPHDDHDDQPHDDHDDQPHNDHDDQPHDDHDDQPHDDHDDQFGDDASEVADEFVSDELGARAIVPGSFPMTVQNVQIPNAPPGTYFVGTFTANVAADGTTTISNWNVTLNFAWPGGGTSVIPSPQ